MVVGKEEALSRQSLISIPKGAIGRIESYKKVLDAIEFQFQKVQLVGHIQNMLSLPSYISIPKGAIGSSRTDI